MQRCAALLLTSLGLPHCSSLIFSLVLTLLTLIEGLFDAAAGPHSETDGVQGSGSRQEKQQPSVTIVFPGAAVTSYHKRSGLKQHELSILRLQGQQSEPWQQESAGPAPSGGEFPSWPLPACISQLVAPSSHLQSYSAASSRLCPPPSLLLLSYKDPRDYQDSLPSSASFSHLLNPFGHGR